MDVLTREQMTICLKEKKKAHTRIDCRGCEDVTEMKLWIVIDIFQNRRKKNLVAIDN